MLIFLLGCVVGVFLNTIVLLVIREVERRQSHTSDEGWRHVYYWNETLGSRVRWERR